MPAFVYIPLPCIGAILIVAASRLFPYTVMKELWAYDKTEFFILIFTCCICVFEDGAIGLMVGGVVSILRTAIKTQRGRSIDTRTVD